MYQFLRTLCQRSKRGLEALSKKERHSKCGSLALHLLAMLFVFAPSVQAADLPFTAYTLEANQSVLYGPKTARIVGTGTAADAYANVGTYSIPSDIQAPFYLQIGNASASIPKGKTVTIEFWHNLTKVATKTNLFDSAGKTIAKASIPIQTIAVGNLVTVLASGTAPLAFNYRIIGTKKPIQLTKPVSFTPSTITLVNGSSAITKVALSPVPTAAGTLTLTSSSPTIAKVPATIAFVAGQANVDVTVQGLAAGQATIQASLNSTNITAGVTVTPTPASLVSLLPSIQTLQLGASGQMQITLVPAQPQTTVVQLASSDATKVTVAASVSIPAGQTTASFAVQGLAVGAAQITATLPSSNGGAASTLSSQVQVITPPPTVVALLPATTTLQLDSGASSTGNLTVQISATQTTATVVQVSTRTAGIVTVPATVTIPAGQTQASIALLTQSSGNTVVVATLNGSSVEAAVQVNPAPPTLASVAPLNLSLITGATGQLTITLKATHTADTLVTFSASPTGVLVVPGTVTILAGQTQAIVNVTAVAVGQAQIVAALPTGSKNATVDVVPPAAQLTQMLPNPLNVQQGAAANVTLKLNAAQLNPVQVALLATQATILQMPANVTIATGQVTQTFAVQGLLAGSTQLIATINGSSQTIDVVVTLPPPTLATLEPATKSLPKGKLGKLKLTLSSTAQAPTLITLLNSNASVLGAPDQVTVPAGQLLLDIPITALTLGQSTITASLNGSTLSSAITVIDPEIVSIAIEPSPFKVSAGQTSPAKATGTFSDGSTRDITQEAATAWAAGNTTFATVNPISGIKGGVYGVAAGTTTLTAEQAILPSVDDPSPNPIKGSVVLEVSPPLALALSAPQTQLQVGESTTVSITAPYPAGATPIVIALTSSTTSGTGALQFPSMATIGAGLASVNVTVKAMSAGAVALSATSTGVGSGQLSFQIAPAPISTVTIQSISPVNGPVGSNVTITGTGFATPISSNSVAFYGNAPAVIQSGSSTQLIVKVPEAAQTGGITVTNTANNASSTSSPFTVEREQDYSFTASPAVLKIVQGSNGAANLALGSIGTRAYTGLASLSVVDANGLPVSLPAGLTLKFEPSTLSAYQTGKLTMTAASDMALGSYTIIVQAKADISGTTWLRTSRITIQIIAKADVTGIKGRFVTPSGQGIQGVIVRQDNNVTVQTTSDAAGNFLLTGLASGAMTVRMDATPANPLYPIWPLAVVVEAGQLITLSDWVINPPPADDKFTPIQNASVAQHITDPRYPGFDVTLPAGATIVGWDGVQKTRIAVQRIDVDKLPVPQPPVPIREAYQLFFGSPMGGIPSTPIPITIPNVTDLEPGEQTEIWWYDGSPMGGTGEWKMAGMGTISADGKQVVSNPGVGIPRFCGVCGLFAAGCPPIPTGPPPPPCPKPKAGNPIDLYTGMEMPSTSGLSCGGLTPMEIGMSYNPVDAFQGRSGLQGSVGEGWVLDNDIVLAHVSSALKRILLPPNERVNFTPITAGDVNYTSSDPRFLGSTLRSIAGTSTPEYELLFKDGRKWRFGMTNTGILSASFLLETTDTQGNSIQITRRSDYRVSTIGNANRNYTMRYGSNGFVDEVRDGANRTLSMTYNASKRIETMTDEIGRVTRYTYVGDNDEFPAEPLCTSVEQTYGQRIKTITYPQSSTPTENFHSPSRRVIRQTGFDGREFKFSYRVTGACVTNIAKPGVICTGPECPNVDSWENYQAGWRIRGGKVVATTVIEPGGGQYTNRYGAQGKILESTNANGQSNQNEHDSKGRTIRTTDALGRSTSYLYDEAGNIIRTTDALGRITDSNYDALNSRMTSQIKYLQTATGTEQILQQYQYDLKGNLLKTTDPLGRVSSQSYTIQSQLKTSTPPDTQTIGAVGTRSWSQSYNPAGDLIQLVNPLGAETNLTPDAVGRTVQTTNPLGYSTQLQYNGLDSITSIQDALGQTTTNTYDSQGRLSAIVNAAGVTLETYTYDNNGRIVSRTDALGKTTSTVYNSAGLVAQVTDRKGQTTTNTYDVQNRIISRTDSEGTSNYVYDAVGNLVSMSHPALTKTYIFDAVNNITQERSQSAAGTTTIDYTYDSLNRITDRKINFTGTNNPSTGATAQPAPEQVTSYQWSKAGQITRISHSVGAVSASNPVQVSTYSYDGAGRLSSKTLPADLTQGNAVGITQSYTYDAADRVTQLKYTKSDGTVIDQIDYSYDAAGQRISKTMLNGTSAPETPMSATFDAGNRMQTITLNPGKPEQKIYNLTYDNNGNLTKKQLSTDTNCTTDCTEYVWDSRNRLTQIKQNQTTSATYSYDAENRRIQTNITSNGNTNQVSYIYAGSQSVGEVRNQQLSHSLMTGLQMDEHIARIALNQGATPQVKTYLTDALGSVIATAKADQSLEVGYAFSPYGQTQKVGVENQQPGSENSSQYTGRENDGNGLYFYRARYYDPVLKRFISEDPIGLDGGINSHGYVEGNPISKTDARGLMTGTDDCSYYDREYLRSGGIYYGRVAPTQCRGQWKYLAKPITRCIRECLQKTDSYTCAPANCVSTPTQMVSCQIGTHAFCWSKCVVEYVYEWVFVYE
jgi:RHS repeat-associated protein